MTETYLEVRRRDSPEVITAIEILSPANKLTGSGRRSYLAKRDQVLDSSANLVELDLLRAGAPMPFARPIPRSDYRVLVSRAHTRPRGHLYLIQMRHTLPTIPIPLQPGDDEPGVDFTALLHALYRRARYDLTLDLSPGACAAAGCGDGGVGGGVGGGGGGRQVGREPL